MSSTAEALHVDAMAEPSDATGPPRKKRKVKTGCITCKIRRVKCDEEKPACARCTSTGRKCDGYDSSVNPRSRKNEAALVKAKQPARPILRPLLADIDGTEMERFYFHCFRNIAGEAVGIRHQHNNLFWKEVVPQSCYEVESTRHAFVALGAAYHCFQTTGERVDLTAPPSNTERFIIQQYSKAIKGLTEDVRHVSEQTKYGITLMCCIAFFCIEILRNDQQAALTHLSNGLQLMANLPEEVVDILKHPEKWSQDSYTTHARMQYMMRMLSRWEVSMRLITGTFQPRLILSAYEQRQLDCTAGSDLSSFEGICEAIDYYCQDISAFTWLTRDNRGDVQFWSQHRPGLQHRALNERSDLIGNRISSFQSSSGLDKLNRQDLIFFHLHTVRFKGAYLALRMLPLPEVADNTLSTEELGHFRDYLNMATSLRRLVLVSLTEDRNATNSNVDLGVVPTLYVTGSFCRDDDLRKKILDLAMDWPQRENLWDGPALRNMLDANGLRPGHARTKPVSLLTSSSTWPGNLPEMSL